MSTLASESIPESGCFDRTSYSQHVLGIPGGMQFNALLPGLKTHMTGRRARLLSIGQMAATVRSATSNRSNNSIFVTLTQFVSSGRHARELCACNRHIDDVHRCCRKAFKACNQVCNSVSEAPTLLTLCMRVQSPCFRLPNSLLLQVISF